ncbi:MAG: ABC transporter ATP-binding protein [Acidobacteriota bacterium]
MTGRGEIQGLEVRGVTHRFGSFTAVRGADLSVQPGKVHCLLGPSGSGKSTLLRLIAGLEELQEGQIDIDGAPVARPGRQTSPERRAVGLVFQDYALFPHLTVLRNVAFGMPRGGGQAASARELLGRVGMEDYAAAMPHTLSGGQQQRVALARALARRPAVMLLDEPFSGLDARLREEIRHSTLDLLRGSRVATLFVTHDPREALLTGDAISVIQAGAVAQTGTPHEVFHRSASLEVARVFGPVNRLSATVRGGRAASPWGELKAPGLAEGAAVDLLVRPGSVSLRGEDPGAGSGLRPAPGRVLRAEQAGELVQLAVTLDGAGLEIEVQDFSRRLWSPGDRVWTEVHGEHVTVREAAG